MLEIGVEYLWGYGMMILTEKVLFDFIACLHCFFTLKGCVLTCI